MPNILEFWSITIDELSRAIFGNGSLRGMVFGYVAEIKLRKLLESHPNVTAIKKDDDHDRSRKGDLRIDYKGHEFIVESKSLQTNQNKLLEDGTYCGFSQVDASDRRMVTLPDGSKVQTTNLLVGEFHVLSVNCFTFENEWHFVFARNHDLPRTRYRGYTDYQREHLLATLVPITWPPTGVFTDDVFSLLDAMIKERKEDIKPPEVILVEEEGKLPDIIVD